MLDVNDETPTFFPAVYNVSVSEDVPRDFRVVWLNCTDNDAGLNAELSYFITGAALPPLLPMCAPSLPPPQEDGGGARVSPPHQASAPTGPSRRVYS